MRAMETSRSRSTRWLRWLAIAFAVLSLACGESQAPEPATDMDDAAEAAGSAEEAATETPTLPGSDASDAEIVKGAVPDDYPSDMPVYPESEPGTSLSMPGAGMFVTFESDDDPDAIYGYFETELAGSGWSVEEGAAGGVRASKDGRNVNVRANRAPNGRTSIGISIKEG